MLRGRSAIRNPDPPTTLTRSSVVCPPNDQEPLFEEALEASRATLGERHPIMIASQDHMAALRRAKSESSAKRPRGRENIAQQQLEPVELTA